MDPNKAQNSTKRRRDEAKAYKREKKEKQMMRIIQQQRDEEEKQVAKKIKLEKEEEERKQIGRPYTVSLALPGSILDNAQTPELRTYLAGQIARAAVVFNIDEIVIFDETGSGAGTTEGDFQGVGKKGNCNIQMARVLQYLECPQYLRKSFFPQHKDLQYAGLLNPLDCLHHPRADVALRYREGVVLKVPSKKSGDDGSLVDCGLRRPVTVDKTLKCGVRVTVDMGSETYANKLDSKHHGRIVSPNEPRQQQGLYWGYRVRLAENLSSVFTQCPHAGGYDVTIGTSERGESVDTVSLQSFNHLLVIFGGLQGLEASLEADQDLKIDDPSLLFDHYLNTCPSQGSNTIRTEEAILITFSALRPKFLSAAGKC